MKQAWQMLGANRYDEAYRLLASFRPAPGDVSPYYHAAALALERSGKVHASFEKYRLAYLFAVSRDAKERLMLERAEAYLKAGFDHEAALCYEVFLRSFPWSQQKARAHLGLADSRYRIGEYNEARRLYGVAGTSSRALYGKANALHALGRYAEAQEIYLALILRDKGFLNTSEETRYSIGENFRQTGLLSDAKIYLNSVQSPALKPRANLSLGLIALREGSFDAAITHLSGVEGSATRPMRQRASLALADAYAKAGRLDDAAATLERIVNDFPSGGIYGEAALRLSRAYRGKERFDKAAEVLRRLLAGVSPSQEVLDELEALVLAARDRNHETFLAVWKAAGQWLLEPSRSGMLLTVVRSLQGSGNTFLDVARWLLKHGSNDARRQAGLLLAEFYSDLGDTTRASRYLEAAGGIRDDAYRRVATRTHAAGGNTGAAVDAVLSMREPRESDLLLLLDAAPQYRGGNIADFCEKALRTVPGTVRLLARYADFLYDAGRRSDARRYYQAAVAAGAGPGTGASMQKDREWAGYRLMTLSPGPGTGGTATAAPAQPGKNPAGRLAEADRRGNELLRKARKVL